MEQPRLRDLCPLTVEIVRWRVGDHARGKRISSSFETTILQIWFFFDIGSCRAAFWHTPYTMRAAICGGRPAAWTRKRRPRRCAIDTYNGWRCAETPVYLATQGLYTATHAAGAYVTDHVLTWPSPELGVVCWVDKLRCTRLNSWSLETADLE